MAVTDARRLFVTNEFRIVKATNATATSLYGSKARKTDQPIPTSLEAEADAQAIADARISLLSNGRRMNWTVAGEALGMGINYVGASPTVTAIDDERAVSGTARIDEIQINFATEETLLETWG